eukprot:jgi/Botrbrau1/5084/Bobra.37_1s0046.1
MGQQACNRLIALSTVEAEILFGGTSVLWFTKIGADLGEKEGGVVNVVYTDNTCALANIKGIPISSGTKHIAVRYHRVWDEVERGAIIPKYVSTTENIADMFTKCNPKNVYHALCLKPRGGLAKRQCGPVFHASGRLRREMNTLTARCAVLAISLVFVYVVEHVIAQDTENNPTLAREYWLGQVYGITPQAIRSNQRLAAEISNIQNTTLEAPLVNRSLLEYALPYAKLTLAAYSDAGIFEGLLNAPVNAGSESLNAEQLQQIARSDIPLGFGIWAWVFGVYDQLDKVKLLTSILPGIDGLTGWGSQCQLANGTVFGASTAYLVTFKGAPGKLGIFWRGTEVLSLRTYTETLCWWPVPLLPENGGPCPPGPDGTPCYVVSGLQQQFSRLRDLILPTWRELSGSDSPPHTCALTQPTPTPSHQLSMPEMTQFHPYEHTMLAREIA